MDIKFSENGELVPDLKPNNKYTEIIGKFIKKERLDSKQVNWGAEIKMLKKLLKEYPDEQFWGQLDLGFKLNSLAFFLTANGKKELKLRFKKFSFDLANSQEIEYDLAEENLVEVKSNKPKSLMDFMK